MEAHKRHIKKLHLRTNDESIIQRSVALFEDAFNIASLPGIPPNGLVFIRRLNLGRITNISSSIAISQCIDEKVRLIASSAVRVEEEDLPQANVVWFKDELAPYIALTSLIAKGKKPRAWYWKKAVPSWNPTALPYQSILGLIKDAVTTPAKTLAPALILDKLVQLHREEIFLNSLTPQDATRILHRTGVYPYEIPNKAVVISHLQPESHIELKWQKSLQHWIQQWGPQDNRSLWLSYNTLLIHNPAYVDNSYIVETSQKLVKIIHENGIERTRRTEKSLTSPKSNLPKPINKEGGIDHLEIDTFSRNEQHSRSAENELQLARQQNAFDQSSQLSLNDDPDSDIHIKPIAINKKLTEQIREDKKQKEGWRAYKEGVNKESNINFESETLEQTTYEEPPKWESIDQGVFTFTSYAGFPFVIGLLERLGIQDVLKADPHFTAINLPAQILWAIIHRLNIPDDDPVCAFLSKAPEVSQDAEFEFVAPKQWIALLGDKVKNDESKLLRLITIHSNKHILTDRSARIVLAIWSHQQPAPISTWLQNRKILAGSITPASDLHYITTAFVLMMELYLERYVGISLSTMVKRKGLIATTKTHVDVWFDPQYADIRIRKAGLDIDPGWIPWLGKVIQYYYEEEGYNYV